VTCAAMCQAAWSCDVSREVKWTSVVVIIGAAGTDIIGIGEMCVREAFGQL